ncbi:hypothetical protein HF521_009792 [Silurus meridionalis]|uniref:Uncharacterized protein n=1 Tax=Silurus meridionalis TaxID=175797 RepID=A0A8T0BZ57_SILME|nr:hypothetical protein HF521_009792 [Silurus meridionalis]
MEKCTANFSYWTLHGLWPNSGAECNMSWHFNASLIEDLLPEMKEFWPNLLKPTSTEFCGDVGLSAQIFGKTLELYHKLDLNGVLKKNNIVPSENYYKLTDVVGSISGSYGVDPKIQCVSHDKMSEFQILGQIEICFDKQFQLVDCENSAEEIQKSDNDILPFAFNGGSGFHVCDASVPVYYPPLQTLHFP